MGSVQVGQCARRKTRNATKSVALSWSVKVDGGVFWASIHSMHTGFSTAGRLEQVAAASRPVAVAGGLLISDNLQAGQ